MAHVLILARVQRMEVFEEVQGDDSYKGAGAMVRSVIG